MNLDHARYFADLARTQHIQKTAKRLGISPTAISHGISRLEDELGFALTTKAGRNILLTDKGLEFARKIEGILRQLDGLKEELAEDRILPGTYTVALTHGLPTQLFHEGVIRDLLSSPGVTFELSSLRSAEVVRAVAEGAVDLGICYSPQSHPRLRTQTLDRGQLLFAARESHPVHRAKTVAARIAALNDSPAIGTKAFQGIDNCERHPVLARLKLRPDYRMVVDSYEAMIPLLLNSNSWALIAESVLRTHPTGLRAISLGHAPAPYTIDAVWNRDRKPLLLYRNLLKRMSKGPV